MATNIPEDIIVSKDWTLFLDRDGVLNTRRVDDYVKTPEEFIWLPGVLDALKKMRPLFGKFIVVTNQRGIARGLYTENDLLIIHNRMVKDIENAGSKIDGVFYCPHFGNEEYCNCRKPKPGMALQAKQMYGSIDFKRSVMIGDSQSDMDFGNNLGMFTVTVSENIRSSANLFAESLYHFSTMLKG